MTPELLERLDRLAGEAAARYPYYRGLNGTATAFRELPFVDKATINAHREQFETASDDGKLLVSYTSGSTGTPFRCVRTKEEQLTLAMAIQRSRRRWGLPLNHRSLLLGNSLFADPRMVSFYANQALLRNPHLIQGRCSGLFELARHFEHRGLPVPTALVCVQNWGEYVQPAQRREIERIFGVPLLDYYGMEEIWLIAFTGREGELEIDERLVYVETLDPQTGQPTEGEEIGELAVTSFVMRSLPFLRYRTGDFGRVRAARGARGPVLELLPFRQSQIKLRSRTVDASVLRYLDRFYQSLAADLGMKQFQLKQESYELFRLSIVADSPPEAALREAAQKLERLLKKALVTDALKITVERAESIPPHPVSGKCMPFVSLLP